MDHDQRFKALIREFFPEFMQLFLPKMASQFDFDTTVWLDKEILPDPPEGQRHILDLVAKLRTIKNLTSRTTVTDDEWLALVHIEIESEDRTTILKPRLPRYYHHLRDKHRLPVLPIVLYLSVGMDGIGEDTVIEYFGTMEVMRFRYLYIGLKSLDALEYARGSNIIGVALSALMKAEPEQWPMLAADALLRIADAPVNSHQRFLLSDCLQAYLTLDEAGRELYQKITKAEPYSRIQAMNKTPYDHGMERGRGEGIEQGIEQGIERGRKEGIERGRELGREQNMRDVTIALLESKYRAVPEPYLERIGMLGYKDLLALVVRIPDAPSMESLFPSN